jgi:hypothetical protein
LFKRSVIGLLTLKRFKSRSMGAFQLIRSGARKI